jgi:protein-tyrosine phosphatase
MNNPLKIKVLFVCMGNICRSPTAHGVFRQLVMDAGLLHLIEVDSAGTHAYHLGEAPDRRARETALERGVDIGDLRARRAQTEDFYLFDHIFAMDQDNFDCLSEICPQGMEGKLKLFMDYAPEFKLREVPDPYYGGQRGFDRVFDMLESAARGLLAEVVGRLR